MYLLNWHPSMRVIKTFSLQYIWALEILAGHGYSALPFARGKGYDIAYGVILGVPLKPTTTVQILYLSLAWSWEKQ